MRDHTIYSRLPNIYIRMHGVFSDRPINDIVVVKLVWHKNQFPLVILIRLRRKVNGYAKTIIVWESFDVVCIHRAVIMFNSTTWIDVSIIRSTNFMNAKFIEWFYYLLNFKLLKFACLHTHTRNNRLKMWILLNMRICG